MASFPDISRISYEGPKSKNLLAFKHYNPDELVEGRRMRDHLRFSIVYWHTMCGQGADMFGGPTAIRPWDASLGGIDLGRGATDFGIRTLVELVESWK